MKHYLLVLLAFLLSFSAIQAQQPFPKAADNPVWNTIEDYFWDPGITQNTWTMTSDTQLCGQTYQIAEAGTPNGWIPGYYKGYIRNQGDQVYYRIDTNCSNPEQLMYDYSLIAGDTFFMDHDPFQAQINNSPTFHIVQSVSTTSFLGINRKVIKFDMSSTPLPFEWIQGVGDIYHPFYTLLYRGTEEDLKTMCLDSMGIQIYQAPFVDSCIIIVGTPEPELNANSMKVYPNPSSHGWKLSAGEGLKIDLIEIYDQVGRLVYRESSNKLESLMDRGVYQVPTMKEAGIYFIQVQSGDQKWSEKLIQTKW